MKLGKRIKKQNQNHVSWIANVLRDDFFRTVSFRFDRVNLMNRILNDNHINIEFEDEDWE